MFTSNILLNLIFFWQKEVFECYNKVLVGNLVASCSEGVTEATAETLDTVMECGKEKVGDYVKENVR